MSEQQTKYIICDVCRKQRQENEVFFFVEGALGVDTKVILPKQNSSSLSSFSGVFNPIYTLERQHICLKCMKNLIRECGEYCE